MNNVDTLGIRLRSLIFHSDYNIKQTAELLHVRPDTISGYIRGKHFPDLYMVNSICNLFKVSSDYLLGRESVEEN